MNKADDILKLAHAYAIKGEYEPFRAAVESLAADAARTDELKWVVNLLNEYGLQALDVVLTFKTVALSAPAVPKGFKLVPIEPTQMMKLAGAFAQNYRMSEAVYRAMLAAAPQPQEQT